MLLNSKQINTDNVVSGGCNEDGRNNCKNYKKQSIVKSISHIEKLAVEYIETNSDPTEKSKAEKVKDSHFSSLPIEMNCDKTVCDRTSNIINLSRIIPGYGNTSKSVNISRTSTLFYYFNCHLYVILPLKL